MSTKYVFSKSLKELRFLFCHTSSHGDATRTFLKRAYPTMKKHNPYTPIMIREAADIEPRIFARYGTSVCRVYLVGTISELTGEFGFVHLEFGKEKQESLQGLSDKEIEQKVTTLVKGEA
ncbi:hypothetical protein LOZ53_000540 [Ophidiomyces ophidiicola]|uniref:Uncharacterized protein n=1 Tax=Ophidiomyces ophidiicola TaxID=1387563 RepID=A0ACB8V4F3_9EURO|nr:uncharacterized protein LOZ57_001689 [Ophidiomyces ophidiicola]KAI1913991.1 hypothetical protein LOZ61_002409 [Ophidiomyces ophidiicola]KAI1921486.1 hypothetical protein LOZ64_001467 [Ophidiomyces ophidiicola]KAI1929494.1 hypothetical protein LOZ60_001515 [Ophidiomyces ophidiicola]KAI1948909.1 hypothetical protein LOZ62_002421 [Ophidiomyces ophidiicola]KAI1951136.1 hypothetical protein LOZ57_001689 [Ophidiomyces ophidiicola]